MSNPNNQPKNNGSKTEARKQHSAAFKAQVVVEALRETTTIGQIASDHQLHPNLVTKWKQEALAGLPTVFERSNAQAKEQAVQEQKVAQLYQEIGRLTTQVRFYWGELAEKKSGLEPDA